MAEEKVITLTEFKVVIEEIKSQNKKLVEVIQHNQEQTNKRFDRIETDIHRIKGDIHVLKEQTALLHEGQTEIKSMLSQKVDRDEFTKLEKRVARLERRTA